MNLKTLPANHSFLLCMIIALSFLAAVFSVVIFLLVTDYAPKKGELFVVEEYRKANIVVNPEKTMGNISSSWQAFAQGGEEAGNMLLGTEELMKSIKPSYIRLDHIFDDDYYRLVSSNDGKLVLNWTKLDEAVDSITSMGAKPFLSLTYMPSAFAENKIAVPYNWDQWQWLVNETILHFSGENNKAIEDVYYEIWNEPDLESFGSWKYYGNKNYLTLYERAAKGAVDAKATNKVKPFKIGGPGITALYPNWINALINHSKQTNLPLDFISWHRYTLFPDQYKQDLDEIGLLLANTKYELIISEWGPNSEKSGIYSTNYAASHAVAVVRQLLNKLNLSLAFEVKDGPNQGDNGWGILTHNLTTVKAKPRYYAFAYMKDMYGQRVDLEGEGSNVVGWAVRDKEETRVLITNFNALKEEIEEFPVKFINLKPGTYRYSWESLKGKSQDKIATISAKQNYLEDKILMNSYDILKMRLNFVQPQISSGSAIKEKITGFGQLITVTSK